jgi:hypothetical protein
MRLFELFFVIILTILIVNTSITFAETETMEIRISDIIWPDANQLTRLNFNTTMAKIDFTIALWNFGTTDVVFQHSNLCKFGITMFYELTEEINHEYILQEEDFACAEAIAYDNFKPGITYVDVRFRLVINENEEYADEREKIPDGIYNFYTSLTDFQKKLVKENLGLQIELINNTVVNMVFDSFEHWPDDTETDIHNYYEEITEQIGIPEDSFWKQLPLTNAFSAIIILPITYKITRKSR